MAKKERVGTFSERLRYWLDNFLARGSGALFLSLVIVFCGVLLAVGIGRFVVHLIAPDIGGGLGWELWVTFLELTDPGNMSQDSQSAGILKFWGIIAGMSGVVIFSALIAFLTTALDQAIANLKEGRSPVLEREHTLILGWGPRVVEILKELVEANESEDDPVVTVLADVPKEEMDEFLRLNFHDRRNTRLVTRSGSTSAIAALRHINAHLAKSAIVLAHCDDSAPWGEKLASDARVIKSVLALEAVSSDDGGEGEFPMVAEIFEPRNREVVRDVSPGRVAVVDAQEILAKVMVQTSRTSGLSTVYAELLSFDGCEMYFYEAPWNGISFAACQFHFEDGVPIGVRKADGSIIVRPSLDTRIENGDDILIVAQDDSTIDFQPQPVVTPAELEIPRARIQQRQERKLIIGWTSKAPVIIREYADYVLEGSSVDIVLANPPPDIVETIRTLNTELESIQVTLFDRDPLDRKLLSEMHPFSYNDVTVLPRNPEPGKDPERIDAETLVVLLHLRRLKRTYEEAGHRIGTKIVTEVVDSANQELISQAGVNDFLISNQMVSMILAQLSEEPAIQKVYDDLFEEDGSEIYVKPAGLYFPELPVRCRFAELMRVAQKRQGEVCIGFKVKALETDGDKNFGVTLIPPKDSQVTLSASDALVVVAEDDR